MQHFFISAQKLMGDGVFEGMSTMPQLTSTSGLLGELTISEIERCLRGEGLSLQVSAFRCLLRSDTGLLAEPLHLLYRHYRASAVPGGFYDFRISLKKKQAFPWSTPEVEFDWEGHSPFPALPLGHAHPLFEWGLNWCIATLSGAHTVIHSAVVERGGDALVLPGQPGAGKSTLCAALALTHWRLLSDELTIISQQTDCVQAMPRPISLKGTSIDLVRNGFAQAVLSRAVHDTHKGSIAYVQPPRSAVQAWDQTAKVGYVVFPRYVAGTDFFVEPISRAQALAELMKHTFNVGLLGQQGFESLARAIAGARCYAVEYPDLASITSWIDATCNSQD